MIEWILDPANVEVVPSVLTLAASIIAALAALVIAFTAYPWQKRLDRDADIRKERRQLYASIVEAIHHYTDEIERAGVASEETTVVWANFFHKVFLYAPANVAHAIFEYADAEIDFSYHCYETTSGKHDDQNSDLHQPILKKQKTMILRMREDLHINKGSQKREVDKMLRRFSIGP